MEKRKAERETDAMTDAAITNAAAAGRQSLAWEQVKDRIEPILDQILEIIDTLNPDEITDAESRLTDLIHESFDKRIRRKRTEDRHQGEEES